MLAVDPANRPSIENIKNHPWYKGQTTDVEALRAEFLKRKELVDAELKRQREAKQKQKLMAKMQTHHAQGAFTGIKPFRSLETEMESTISKELEAKLNLDAKREIQEYQSEGGFKAYTEVFTVMSSDFIFKLLCSIAQNNLADFSVSSTSYKLKGKAVKDEGSCNLNIVLTKVDESTTCVEFHKTSGNVMTFYKVVDEFKKKLPVVEVEGEETEKTESQ